MRTSWPRNWLRALLEVGSVTPERQRDVLREIDEGSQPSAVYYILLGLFLLRPRPDAVHGRALGSHSWRRRGRR